MKYIKVATRLLVISSRDESMYMRDTHASYIYTYMYIIHTYIYTHVCDGNILIHIVRELEVPSYRLG